MADGMSEADMAKAQQEMTEAERAQQQQQQQAPPPSAGDVGGIAATRRRPRTDGKSRGNCRRSRRFRWIRQEEEAAAAGSSNNSRRAPPPAAAAAPAPAAGAAGPTPPGTLMELTTELTAFSSAPVDAAKLSVPAGFKQVDHDMQKALK